MRISEAFLARNPCPVAGTGRYRRYHSRRASSPVRTPSPMRPGREVRALPAFADSRKGDPIVQPVIRPVVPATLGRPVDSSAPALAASPH
jgi:hypothetical protein